MPCVEVDPAAGGEKAVMSPIESGVNDANDVE